MKNSTRNRTEEMRGRTVLTVLLLKMARAKIGHAVRFGCLVFVCLFCFTTADAATKTWTGAVSIDWNTAGNWSPAGVPLSGDDAVIPANLPNYPVINGTIAIKTITMTAGAGTQPSVTVSGGKLTVNGTLSVNAGTVTQTGGTIAVTGGEIFLTGALNVSGGAFLSTVRLNVQTGGQVNVSGATTVFNMAGAVGQNPSDEMMMAAGATFTQTGGTVGIKEITMLAGAGTPPSLTVSGGKMTVDGNILINAGTLTQTGGTILVTNGLVAVVGTMNISGGTFSSTVTVEVRAGGVLNLSGTGLLDLANTTELVPTDGIKILAGGTINQSGGFLDVKDFSSAAGTPAGTYNQTGGTFRIYHDFKSNGVFYSTGGTIDFAGNGGGGTFPNTLGPTQFYNVVVNADANFDNDPVSFKVAGNWTANVPMDLSGKATTVTFNGTGAQTIGGTAATTFANVVVDKPSGTVTLALNETIKNGNLSVLSGTLDLGVYTMNRTTLGGTATVANGATLKIGGTNSFPANYAVHTLGATSTVEYYGTNQTVTAETYGHLILSGSGVKTMPASPLTVQGNFTMAGTASATAAQTMTVHGNFTLGTGTTFGGGSFGHSIRGNFSNSGTFNGGTSTFTFNGTSAQTIGGSNPTTFNSLTVNNSKGVVLGGVDTTVKSTLTFNAGTITTGANTVIVPSGGSVSRTSGHVAGRLQKYVATGATVRTFEVGDAANYTPVTVSFASVSVAGDLTVSTTAGDHPLIGGTNFDAARTANRHWTVTNSGVVFTSYSVTFTYVAADLDVGASPDRFILGKYSSETWSYPAVGTLTSTSVQATGLTTFSDFQVGEGGPPSVELVKGVNPSGASLQPGTDLSYTVTFTNSGASYARSLVISDPIPTSTDFKVGSESRDLGTTGLSVAVSYSSDNGVTWTYTPVSGGGGAPEGYDRNVTTIRWAFTGNLRQTSPNNTGNVSFTARIK